MLTRQLGWTLDHLGNWTGDLSGPGLLRDDYLNGVTPATRTQDVSHAVDHANQLEAVTVAENGGDSATQTMIHDAAGSRALDTAVGRRGTSWCARLLVARAAGRRPLTD